MTALYYVTAPDFTPTYGRKAVEVALNRGNAVIVAANVNLKAVDGVVTGTMYGVGVEMGVKTFMETVDMSQWEGYVIPF